jgi:hypothetical protein
MKTRTYVITGPDEQGQYLATCTEEPQFRYETEKGPSRALDGLLWVMTDDSPKSEDDDE